MLEKIWRKKENPPTWLEQMLIGSTTMENSMEIPKKKKKKELPYDLAGHISRENHTLKNYMHPNVHCSIIYNNQDMEAM